MGQVQRRILLIRGHKVMLDTDLADLYSVKPIALRQQIKRNPERFPEDFMFQLTETETEILVSQNVIPSRKHLGGHLPYVFTQEGIAMLSSVLRKLKGHDHQIRSIFQTIRQLMAPPEPPRRRIGFHSK